MAAKKFFILFMLASLAGHALVLALTTRFDWIGSSRPGVTTVELKAPFEHMTQLDQLRDEETPPEVRRGSREDSVALQDEKSQYNDYLLLVRRKIEQHWSYPPQALSGKQEGKAVIRFTIDRHGTLMGVGITTTSGSPVLDEGTLAAIRAAAPYAPIPADFNLTRLHITASFNYRMDP